MAEVRTWACRARQPSVLRERDFSELTGEMASLGCTCFVCCISCDAAFRSYPTGPGLLNTVPRTRTGVGPESLTALYSVVKVRLVQLSFFSAYHSRKAPTFAGGLPIAWM